MPVIDFTTCTPTSSGTPAGTYTINANDATFADVPRSDIYALVKDLSATPIADFVIRFEITVTEVYAAIVLGFDTAISPVRTVVNSGAADTGFGLTIITPTSAGFRFNSFDWANGAHAAVTSDLTLGTKYYVEATRHTSGTRFNCVFRTGSHAGSVAATLADIIIPGTVYDYLVVFGNRGDGSTAQTSCVIENLEIVSTISLTNPTSYKPHQRNSRVSGQGVSDVAVAGTYSGAITPTGIEARTVYADESPGAEEGWESISFAAGSFSGTLAARRVGVFDVEVRYANATDVNDSVTNCNVGDIAIVLGQSNAEGIFTNQTAYAAPAERPEFVAAFYKYNGGAWAELVDYPFDTVDEPVSDLADYGSGWTEYATLHMATHQVPLSIIGIARGGTGLVGGVWSPPSGTQYSHAVTTINLADVNGVSFMAWFQGESDQSSGQTAQAWQDATIALFDALAAACPVTAGAKVVIYQPSWATSSPVSRQDPIRAAAANLPLVDARFVGPVISCDQDFTGGAYAGHWRTDEQRTIYCARVGACVNAIFGAGNDLPPRLTLASRNDAGTEVYLDFDRSVSIASSNFAAFNLLDAGVNADSSFSSISASGTRLTIALSTPLAGVTTIDLGAGNDANGAVYPKAATGVEHPVVPFVGKRVYTQSELSADAFRSSRSRRRPLMGVR